MASNVRKENEAPEPSANEGEVFSGSRHKHSLYMKEGFPPYKCSGCKQFGANVAFKCRSCSKFILHEVCAGLPDELVHPFFSQHAFKFCSGTLLRHHCDLCGEVIRGFVFESRDEHLKFHPLCMALPANLSNPKFFHSAHENHDLKLVVEGKKRKWKCRCETCKSNLDMETAILNFYGLSEYAIFHVQRPTRGKHILGKLASVVKLWGKSFLVGVALGLGDALIDDC